MAFFPPARLPRVLVNLAQSELAVFPVKEDEPPFGSLLWQDAFHALPIGLEQRWLMFVTIKEADAAGYLKSTGRDESEE